MRKVKLDRWSRIALLGVALVAALALVFAGCSRTESPTSSDQSSQIGPVFSLSNPTVQKAIDVQNRHTASLMADPDVVGTATGLTNDGRVGVLVLVLTRQAAARIPAALDGMPVRTILTDPIVAVKGPPGGGGGGGGGGGADHTARQPRPIQLGVSGGNAYDLANGYCCSGTLGALIAKGGTYYILSNSHVFAGDFASSSGDPDVAQIGDPINQPGLVDVQCQDNSSDYVANLSSLSTLDPSTSGNVNVDAAIAAIISGQVRTDGSILEIGVLSSQTVGASVNQKVKKSGRTTGLTRSSIDGINATVNVGYEDECNGNSFTKTFTGQILVKNRGSKFLNSGDSGSLMVEDANNNPRAVGLLYAGSSTVAVANPIDDVLSHFNATMVGQ